MHKAVKAEEKPGASIEMKFVTHVKTAAETSETERAAEKQIVNFVKKDATHDANIAAKRDAESIAVIIGAETIAVIT
jgi:hypothetical protein